MPFATAATTGWKDVPAGGELLFWAAYHALGGGRGLLALQVLAAAIAFGALARGLGREASTGSALVVCRDHPRRRPARGAARGSLDVLARPLSGAPRAPPGRGARAEPPDLARGAARSRCGATSTGARSRAGRSLPATSSSSSAAGGRPGRSSLLAGRHGRARRQCRALAHADLLPACLRKRPRAKDGSGLWSPLHLDFVGVLLLVALAALAALVVARGASGRGSGSSSRWPGSPPATVHVERSGDWLLFVAAYPAARALRLGAPTAEAAALAGARSRLHPAQPASRSDPRAVAADRQARRADRPAASRRCRARAAGRDRRRAGLGRRSDRRVPAGPISVSTWTGSRASRKGRAAVDHAGYVLVQTDSPAGRVAAADPRLGASPMPGTAALYRVRPA